MWLETENVRLIHSAARAWVAGGRGQAHSRGAGGLGVKRAPFDLLTSQLLYELGSCINFSTLQDKTNGYDFFYRQSAIKPALVGLAGPWISGGVEFNW